MSHLYVENIASNTKLQDLIREFEQFGELCGVRIPQSFSGGPNHAFVEFKRQCDFLRAFELWKGKFNWRVEFVENSGGSSIIGRYFGAGKFNNCEFCGGFGHFSGDCTSDYEKDLQNKGVEQFKRIRLEKNKVASTSTGKPAQPPPPPWVELPQDITEKILRKLGPIGLLCVAQHVCTSWRKICLDPTMWRVIDMWRLANVDDSLYELSNEGKEALCSLAVDVSQGQVTEINIEEFGCDNLLEYIAERCGNLRCLRLAFCNSVSSRSLSKAVERFPLLEELHLQCTYVEKQDIEAIGQSCPMLKTFVLNGIEASNEALAVATSMPELRHLQLFGNRLTNEVLDTILNGCPKLESLDLRHCFNLDLDGELGKRCAQQIKVLRHPDDPNDDYEWFSDGDYESSDDHENVSEVSSDDDFEYYDR